jgi:hypothetical protein
MQRRKRNDPYNISHLRFQLKEAFKRIRKKKLYARMNFLCCSSCASYDLSTKLNNSNTKLGYAYWHSQDEESLQTHGYLLVGYGAKVKKDHVKVGQMIVDTLEEMGIPHKWSGDSDERILVGKS